jgi:flagellar protein FlgJ
MDSRFSSAGGSASDTAVYTDINRLGQLKLGGDSEENIHKVAKEFESLFLNEMIKSMRSANEAFGEGNFMNSNATKMYQDMYDKQLSVTLAGSNNGIGLAEVLERQMRQMKKPSERPNPFAQTETATSATSSKSMRRSETALHTTTAAKAAPAEESAHSDAALLNRRRLSLSGTFSPAAQQTVASGSDTAGSSVSAASLSTVRSSVKSYAAPVDRRLTVTDGNETATQRTAFNSAQEFIETMLPMAEKAAAQLGVDASYLVAQAALETGWGKSIIKQADGSSSYNLFGIKTHNRWSGESAQVTTTEYRNGKSVKEGASFRAYDSFAESFNDYVSFLQNNGRYEKALESTANPDQFTRELQKAGYATDPQYARKVSQIARKVDAYQAVEILAAAVTGNPRT